MQDDDEIDDDNDDSDTAAENTEDEMTWCESLEAPEMFELIDENSYVAIHAPTNSLEMFFMMKIIEE